MTGWELNSVGVTTTGVAEQLSADLQEESDAQELFHALATAGGTLQPHERLREYELEIERLHAKVDHLKSQLDVINITLAESKAHCDNLSIMMGKFESNSTALQMAVSCLDNIVESYEVVMALQESEISLLLASCRAAGIGEPPSKKPKDPEELVANLRRAQEQRRSTENVARHLLSRLYRNNKDHDSANWDIDTHNTR